ncbi:MAG: PKD domain-containing protein [Halobacteriota archaeon]
MNNKKGKGIIGIALAAIMIASIFAVIAPTGADVKPLVNYDLGKETIPAGKEYNISERIDYTMRVGNPAEAQTNFTVNVTDEYPNGTVEVLNPTLTLEPGENVTYNRSYVVDIADIQPDDRVWNKIIIDGETGCDEPFYAEATKASKILLEKPVFEFDFNHTCCCNMTFYNTTSHGEIVNHTWDFGDGTTETINEAPGVISHTYASCGNMTVTLSGYDNHGLTNSTMKTVYVPCPPMAKASADKTWVQSGVHEMVTFSGCESEADENAPWLSIVNYTWTFSDGHPPMYGCNVTRVVDGAPDATVCATLTVSDGHCNATDTVCVHIGERPNCRIRLYGTFGMGAGNLSVEDPETKLKPENPPYTDPIAPFYPQHEQAPVKDFVTFNPAIMDHNQGYEELDFVLCEGTGVQRPQEKVFKRMWYEKEWFKDHDKDGHWDVVIEKPDGTYVKTLHIDNETAIHEEYEKGNRIRVHNNDPTLNDSNADIYGPAINQEFAYMFLDDERMPIMIRSGSDVLIPLAHDPSEIGRGLNSFDADGDGNRDAVRVESEYTLGLDIDHDGINESMDMDTVELNGNESVVLVLGNKYLNTADRNTIQFFDHRVELKDVYEIGFVGHAIFNVYDNEGGTRKTENVVIPVNGVEYFYRAKPGSPGERETFYLKLVTADAVDNTAIIEVGRMFGQTYANIGANPYWSQKAFIVDEVFYNVVAIKAQDDCIKYIVFREKLPKEEIKLYGMHLKKWGLNEILPEMSPFNMLHEVIVDVQDTWTQPESQQDKIGPKEPRPPLLISYVDEDEEMRYKGELKEIYNETEQKEFWMLEWFWTLPWQYTEFELPAGDTYLVTLSWIANQSEITIWDGDPDKPIVTKTGERFKFWYEDCTGPLYIDSATSSIRLYGTFGMGAGDLTATDPEPGLSYDLKPENPPYTDPVAPFYPQHEQAPRKDFITFNPAIMDHNQGYEELDFVLCEGTGVQRPQEKVFKRMWYDKEWFKDHDKDGCWDVVIDWFNPETGKYEYNKTMCLDAWNAIPEWEKVRDGLRIREWNNDPTINDSNVDIYGPAIKQEFAYMFLDDEKMPIMIEHGSKVLIPMAHREPSVYRGLNSFDADGDGMPDAVRVESEATLGLDIDHDGICESMDVDTVELNGNEGVVLVLGNKYLTAGTAIDTLQFFDHRVTLKDVFELGGGGHAIFDIYDNEGGTRKTENVQIPVNGIEYFYRAKPGSTGERETFYLKLLAADAGENKAIVEIGRMFGQTHANIGANPYWSQKAFIVDEVFYNVVAIKAHDNCIKYIVFREKLPKEEIKLYGKHLEVWTPMMTLPEMPPFNEEHEIIVDVQTTWTRPYSQQDKIGDKVTRPALNVTYVEESEEKRFKGELKEIYNETEDPEDEFWMLEWFHTKPQQYTAFVLPKTELYMVTLGWYAPESVIHIWDDDPAGPITKTGERVKFWYDPALNTDIYVNRMGDGADVEPQTIAEYYDCATNGGNGDGVIDLDEIVNAILDYLHDEDPFGLGGEFDKDDLISYVLEYLHSV